MKLLFTILLPLYICACQSPSPITPSHGEHSSKLSLGIGGEEFAQSGTSNDLLALQIYCYDGNGTKIPYAYGLFDNFAIGDLALTNDSEYSIEATFIRDAKNRIASTTTQKYYAPFILSHNFTTAVSNCFTQSSSYYFTGIMSGESKVQLELSSLDCNRALVERYAGSTGIFKISNDCDVSILLKRVYTTLRLNAEGVTSGVFTLQIDGCEPIYYNAKEGTTDYTVSLAGSIPAGDEWMTDEYSEVAEYNLYFDGGSGSNLVSSGNIELVRSTILPINISVDSKNVNVDLESSDMEVLPSFEIEL